MRDKRKFKVFKRLILLAGILLTVNFSISLMRILSIDTDMGYKRNNFRIEKKIPLLQNTMVLDSVELQNNQSIRKVEMNDYEFNLLKENIFIQHWSDTIFNHEKVIVFRKNLWFWRNRFEGEYDIHYIHTDNGKEYLYEGFMEHEKFQNGKNRQYDFYTDCMLKYETFGDLEAPDKFWNGIEKSVFDSIYNEWGEKLKKTHANKPQ